MGTVATKDRDSTPFRSLLSVPVSLWLVVMLMAMSFGAGVIVKTIAEPSTTATTTTTQLPVGGGTLAPPLTDDQIAGGLPEGHPDLSGDGKDQTGGADKDTADQNQGGEQG